MDDEQLEREYQAYLKRKRARERAGIKQRYRSGIKRFRGAMEIYEDSVFGLVRDTVERTVKNWLR